LNYRRLIQTAVLIVGLAAIAVAFARTVDDARDQVLPSAGAFAAAGGLALIAILASGRSWVTLFHDLLDTRSQRRRFEATYYLSQLTKYLPTGGVVQAASQLSLAASTGVSRSRIALAFPVSVIGTAAAGATLGAGASLSTELPGWARALAIMGLAAPALLHRGLMRFVLEHVRRFVRRVPAPDHLPSQRSIVVYYGWALVSIGATASAYTVLLRSLTNDVNPAIIFCAFALSWTVGFLVLPLPAGIGVREAVLVAALPVGAGPLLAASLAQRLLAMGADVTAAFGSKIVARRALQARQPLRPTS
jgi:glycosyltransferase 2 family protein